MTRRELLSLTGAAPLIASSTPIDRRAVVRRNNPVIRGVDAFAPLTVGNGEFAFTADITGLQTFPERYQKGIPLCTQSNWGWHSKGRRPAGDLRLEEFNAGGRKVGYATSSTGQKELFDWLRENPHRFHLGRISLKTAATAEQLSAAEQKLDLWSGTITSRFQLAGAPYIVRTACHPETDCVAFEIDGPSPAIVLDFPYPSSGITGADWSSAASHTSSLGANGTTITRVLEGEAYIVELALSAGASVRQTEPHRFVVSTAAGATHLAVACTFARFYQGIVAAPHEVFHAAAQHWQRFWTTGGAIDFGDSKDRRAPELERRVVLSQYLTAIQCSGSMPPQETGLTCNSWFGKAHLEMHWWHAAHFPLWGRTPLLSRSFEWYRRILPVARENARRQGYAGARWPKMVGPDGHDSPSNIGPMLIWQQPHIIMLLHLAGVADRYQDLIVPTADFMVSYAEERDGKFHLGPPMIPAQENHPPRETWDPTFELEYWRYALGLASKYCAVEQSSRWDHVRRNLAPLPVKDGVYLAHANCPQTYSERNRDHPSMLAALGMLPGDGVDREIMRATLKRVMAVWKWPDTWGWDFPMMALTATRLDEPGLAIDALLMDAPKNHYGPNGHNYQRPNLPLYLPGNGGLLTAVATMAGRKGGFPFGWNVRWEE